MGSVQDYRVIEITTVGAATLVHYARSDHYAQTAIPTVGIDDYKGDDAVRDIIFADINGNRILDKEDRKLTYSIGLLPNGREHSPGAVPGGFFTKESVTSQDIMYYGAEFQRLVLGAQSDKQGLKDAQLAVDSGFCEFPDPKNSNKLNLREVRFLPKLSLATRAASIERARTLDEYESKKKQSGEADAIIDPNYCYVAQAFIRAAIQGEELCLEMINGSVFSPNPFPSLQKFGFKNSHFLDIKYKREVYGRSIRYLHIDPGKR